MSISYICVKYFISAFPNHYHLLALVYIQSPLALKESLRKGPLPRGPGGGGGVLPENLGGGVRRASCNPILKYVIFNTLFQT